MFIYFWQDTSEIRCFYLDTKKKLVLKRLNYFTKVTHLESGEHSKI